VEVAEDICGIKSGVVLAVGESNDSDAIWDLYEEYLLSGKHGSLLVIYFGAVEASLPHMLLGKTPIKDKPVNVMKLPKELNARCILGMNILQEYDIHISNFNNTIKLTSKPLPKKYFKEDYSVTLATTGDVDTSEGSYFRIFQNCIDL
jgi:hypothetical protein